MSKAQYQISDTLFRMLKFCPEVHHFHDFKAEIYLNLNELKIGIKKET